MEQVDARQADEQQAGAQQEDGQQAGATSPHLDQDERVQAADHAAPKALVIHEVVREEGESELLRSTSSLAWSGLAAGLSMGFSFLALALIQSRLPDAPWRRLFDSVGYSTGFLIVILGRQQLFTESTLTALLPVLTRRSVSALLIMLRLWGVVLVANLVGTALFAALISQSGIFSAGVTQALDETSRDAVSGAFGPTFVHAILSGWLIAVMVWMLPAARSARIFVVLFITYIVAVGRFSHIVAGSVEAAYAVFGGHASAREYLMGFFLPTLLGNTLGGTAMAALLNHAPLVTELRGRMDETDNGTSWRAVG